MGRSEPVCLDLRGMECEREITQVGIPNGFPSRIGSSQDGGTFSLRAQ